MIFQKLFPDNFPEWITENPEKTSVFIIRIMVGVLWLSQAVIKLITRNPDPNADFDFFLDQLKFMADSNPISLVSDQINTFLIPNSMFLVWIVIFTELFVGMTMIFGLFTRLGAFIGMGNTLNLYVFTLGWGEWLWTYPLIFAPLFIIFFSDSGRQIGIDRILYPKVQNTPIKYLL